MPSPKPSGCRVSPVFVLLARQLLLLSLGVFMGGEILITHRAEVNGLVAHADGVLFAPTLALCQNDFRLLTTTYAI